MFISDKAVYLHYKIISNRKRIMKKKILTTENIIRLIRFATGAAFAAYGLATGEYFFLPFAALLLYQAIFNVSCCCAGSCSSQTQETKQVYSDVIKPYSPDRK